MNIYHLIAQGSTHDPWGVLFHIAGAISALSTVVVSYYAVKYYKAKAASQDQRPNTRHP